MREHGLKIPLLVSALAAMSTLCAGTAHAQMHAMVPNVGGLSRSHLNAHNADVEAMITDLTKVQSASDARRYEGFLGGQMSKYVNNRKALHPVTEEAAKLGETHLAKLASEMARVEKLNPGLKKHFDVLRTLD